MKLKAILILLTIYFMTFSCKTEDRKSFSLSIEYSSPWAYPTKYILTQNSITVNGVWKRSDKQAKDVYKRLLTKNESDSIYTFLKSIAYDTLKDSYQNPSFFDGTDIVFKISGEQLKSKKVLVYMRSTKITDTLQRLMQRQVLTDKYKWNNYFKDE